MARDALPIDFVPGIDTNEREKNPRAWTRVEGFMATYTGHELRLRYHRGDAKPYRAALWFVSTTKGAQVEALRGIGASATSFSDAVAQLGCTLV